MTAAKFYAFDQLTSKDKVCLLLIAIFMITLSLKIKITNDQNKGTSSCWTDNGGLLANAWSTE